jgi:hypothetical protein
MRSNIIIAGGLLLFLAIVMTTWKRADLRAKNTWITEKGIVTEMYETDLKDLVLKLQGQAKSYYIDCSMGDLTLAELKDKVLYKPVVIQYPDRWTPLKKENSSHFITSLSQEGEIIYLENH